jgi:two-component system C4-dicarboxylate transport response regulator DctD
LAIVEFMWAAEGGGELPADRRAGTRRILLVEDDETLAAGLMLLLEIENFDVERVATGAAAISSFRRAKPHIVLLDIGLPDMNGREAYAHLAAIDPDIPVVFSTGHGATSSPDRLPTAPHVTSLLKPYELETLLAAIERVCAPGGHSPANDIASYCRQELK